MVSLGTLPAPADDARMPSTERTRVRRTLDELRSVAGDTLDEYSRDRGDLVAAALAFYTLLSIAPLIIIAVAIAGAVLGERTALEEVTAVLRRAMGEGAALTIRGWVVQAAESGALASVVGVALSLFTASRLGAQLRSSLNQIWNVDVSVTETFKESVSQYLERRVYALAVVLAAGPLLLVIFVTRALLSSLSDELLESLSFGGAAVDVAQFAASVIAVAVITMLTLRLIPDVRVSLRAIVPGALLTSVLFNLGNLAVAFYLGHAGVMATYGAAGSVVVVLLWLYFSAQIFLYGAEFTQVYAKRRGLGFG